MGGELLGISFKNHFFRFRDKGKWRGKADALNSPFVSIAIAK